MFCLTLNQGHLPLIKKLKYIPVGLGDSTFNEKELPQNLKSIPITTPGSRFIK